MKKAIEGWIEANQSDLTALSDEIWAHAELGLVEHKSSKAQVEYLEKHGFEINSGVGGMETAFVASWGEGKPVIGFLGEFDALPMVSNKPVPYQDSLVEGGTGHGCGPQPFRCCRYWRRHCFEGTNDKQANTRCR